MDATERKHPVELNSLFYYFKRSSSTQNFYRCANYASQRCLGEVFVNKGGNCNNEAQLFQ
jgi:hypothetical protein